MLMVLHVRALLQATCPGLTPLGLVDYNPSGAVILQTYRFGSRRMGLESGRCVSQTA